MINTFVLAAAILQQGAHQTPAQQPNVPAPVVLKAITLADHDAKHQEDLNKDVELGNKYAVDVLKQYKVSDNKEYTARVERIGQEMAAIARVTPVAVSWGDSRLNPFNYDFIVIKGTDVNAFSLPGGHIYVFEGLVKYVETDDELAGILAHEISHAAFRHVATLQHEQAKVEKYTLPLILVSILTGGVQGGFAGMQAGQLAGMAIGSGWSLKAELAADSGGFQFLTKSKYNPTAMLTVMERLARDERNSPKISLGIFQSHPPSRERAEAIQNQMQAAHIPVQRSVVTTSLRATVKPGDKGTVEIWFANSKIYEFAGDDALQRADEAAPKLNAMFDRAPELYEVQKQGSHIVFGHDTVIDITEEDAAAAKMKVDDLASQTLRNIQGSLYVLAFRVWDDR